MSCQKTIIMVIAFLLLLSTASAICTDLNEIITIDKSFDEDIILCQKEYFIEQGINIAKDNLVIDCNNAKLRGNNLTYGFAVHNKNKIIIKNCVFENFKVGIDVTNSNALKLTNNQFSSNNIGINSYNSETADKELLETDNQFLNNNKNIIQSYECVPDNFCPKECNTENDDDCDNVNNDISNDKKDETVAEIKKGIEIKEPINSIKENIPNDISASVLKNIVTIRADDHEKALSAVEITKTRITSDDKTTYETTIKALQDIKGLAVYEYFPKSIAQNVKEINFDSDSDNLDNSGKFILIEEDPIVKKDIGSMKKDEVVVITYNLDKAISGDTNPSSIVTIENSSRLINTLANISYILAMYLVLVIIKKYKADKMLKEFKAKTKKLLGVPFPIAYIVLSIIPSINYRFLASENIAILFYSVVILILLGIIIYLVKRKE